MLRQAVAMNGTATTFVTTCFVLPSGKKEDARQPIGKGVQLKPASSEANFQLAAYSKPGREDKPGKNEGV